MTRKLVVATFVGVCALTASGCASQVASGGVQAPSSISTSISVPNPPSDLLQDGSAWEFAPPPSSIPPDIVSASSALAVAKASVRGDLMRSNIPVVETLVSFTDLTPTSETDKSPKYTGLAWIVQISGVKIGQSTPRFTSVPLNTISTIQWVINAETGLYVEARDWGNRVS